MNAAPKLTEAQRLRRDGLRDLKRNLSPELYASYIRLCRARDKALRNSFFEEVLVRSQDLVDLMHEFERIYTAAGACRPGTRRAAG